MDNLYMLICSIITAFASGGWFVNYKLKKKAEKITANSGDVDLTDKILKKYQETVLSAMGGVSTTYTDLSNKIDDISLKISDISEYLNGDFVEFQRKKSSEKMLNVNSMIKNINKKTRAN